MITYVVDNNIFSRSFKNLALDVFEDIWNPWSEYMHSERIISVDEVYCELTARWGEESLEGKWLKKHRAFFLKTTNDEGLIVAEIFKNKKFREGVKEASLRNGTPEADALLVAKAKAVGGIIVTAESDKKPNSEKIPNMAVAFGVPYMGINEFYKMLRNVFKGHEEYTDIYICYELCKPVSLEEYADYQ